MAIELFLIAFTVSLICGLIVRKVVQNRTRNEIYNERYQMRKKEEQTGWTNNDVEGAVYDSDGKRIR